MAIPPLLEELLLAPVSSGAEEAVQAIVRREAEAIGAEITTDVLGSTVARVRGSGSGRLLALFAHADQIGMVIRGAGDDGLLTVAKLADWRRPGCARPARAGHDRCRARCVASSFRLTRARSRGMSCGSTSGALDRDEALGLVRPGDGVVLVGRPEELPNGRVLSGALDDRVGIFACLEALRRIAADPPEWDVAVVVSAQEEGGTHGGARIVAERLAPDVAIAVDVIVRGRRTGDGAMGRRAARWWPNGLPRPGGQPDRRRRTARRREQRPGSR